MFGNQYEQHAQHSSCAVPGCPSFHLFCPTCGERHHVSGVTDIQPPTLAHTTAPLPVSTTSLAAAANTA